MKIFRTVEKNFKSKGIRVERVSFGLYEFQHILAYIVCIMLSVLYVVYVAETTSQYMDSISQITALILVLIAYLSYRCNAQALYKLIDELEQIINQSE